MFDSALELLTEMRSQSHVESCAAAARLDAIGALWMLRLRELGETADWAADTFEAVVAEISMALQIGRGVAASQLEYAQAMRDRLPRIAELLRTGQISYRTFQTLVHRTELITDDEVMAAVDAELARLVPTWGVLSQQQLKNAIDVVVAGADEDAVRRRREEVTDRTVSITDKPNGLSEINATVFTPDAHALGAKLAAVAATVCDRDPRTPEQRRADALAVLAAGADRLRCGCGRSECPVGRAPAAGPVLIHVVTDKASLDGAGVGGALIGGDHLIPADVLAELANNAKLVPLIHPSDCAAEPNYIPSKKLADLVRARDMTCRFPDCAAPATVCDVDHTTPFGEGGATHPSNLKCLCRAHHLLKTFRGWRDVQLPDGTVIWFSPAGDVRVTVPGARMLFPALCTPTYAPTGVSRAGDDRVLPKTAAMPKRTRTRRQNRAARIAAERRGNRAARTEGETRRLRANAEHVARFQAARNQLDDIRTRARRHERWRADTYEPPPF